MTSHVERQRLSAMANALRPDWPLKSLYTLLTDDEVLVKRSYQDVACALAWVATDPETKTPARLGQPGPWWGSTSASVSRPIASDKAHHCEKCGIVHTALSPCSPPDQRAHGRGAEAARAALAAALGKPAADLSDLANDYAGPYTPEETTK